MFPSVLRSRSIIVKPVACLLVAFSSLAVISLSAVQSAGAAVFYVNNRTGSERNDGLVDKPLNVLTGPVKSISRALQLAESGDTIEVANTGVPYYDNLTLQGTKHSGHADRPFTIVGNGATLTGAMIVPSGAWAEVGRDLWKLVPYRKGYFQLVRDGKALSELRPDSGEEWNSVPKLQTNEWCVWHGAVYYQSERLVSPSTLHMSIARRSCGITIFAARHIVISDLTIQHFRLDGVNLHDLATNVQLRNITLRENGRSGLAIGGSSTAQVILSDIHRNRDHSVLIRETSALAIDDCILDADPTVHD